MPDFENREGELFPKKEETAPVTPYGEVDMSGSGTLGSEPAPEKKRGGFFDAATLLSLGGSLFLITLVVSLLLGVVNAVTKEPIAQEQARATNEAMRSVLPQAEDFVGLELELSGDVDAVYEALDSSGGRIGFAVSASPAGFGGDIELMVGVEPDGSVSKVIVVSMSETAGVGTKARGESFLSLFETGAQSAITGATISSDAVIDGVRQATETVEKLISGGAGV